MAENELSINKQNVLPGQNELIRLNIARLPSGTVINLQVHVFRSKNPGPTMLVMGGVHGDEINGVEIVRQAIKADLFQDMKCGNVIAIPLLNIYGFINFSRDASEGKDVNRSFPGSSSGSLASRVAHTLTKKILPIVDFGIDFHTGGAARYNYPQIRFSSNMPRAEELAKAFAAPYLIRKASISKSLRKVAAGMDKPILIYEGGESLRLDGFSIARGLSGLKRVMHAKGMIETAEPSHINPIVFNKTTWVRAAKSGLFQWSQQSGAYVNKGEALGMINDPYGQNGHIVRASRKGYIIGHNNAPVVSKGDALFHIGYEIEGK